MFKIYKVDEICPCLDRFGVRIQFEIDITILFGKISKETNIELQIFHKYIDLSVLHIKSQTAVFKILCDTRSMSTTWPRALHYPTGICCPVSSTTFACTDD